MRKDIHELLSMVPSQPSILFDRGPDFGPEVKDKLTEALGIASAITMSVFGTTFRFRVERDAERGMQGRIFMQVVYDAPCTKTGKVQEWKGRKWYLSDYMTADEIVKTGYAAFEAAVKHEVMEGFKVGGTILFNPHIDYRTLLEVSKNEVSRA